jgi:DNA-binding FadR family transcriptional regulator
MSAPKREDFFAGTALLRGAAPATNVFEATVERLGNSIKLGLLKPGQQLPPERELATLVGVSRVTVRSAIQVLVQGGFLVSRRGRGGGTFVVESPPEWSNHATETSPAKGGSLDAGDFNDRRRVIESGVCEIAAERISEHQVAQLRERVGRLAELVDNREMFRSEDALLHIAIAEATGNQNLVRMVAELQAELSNLISHVPPSDAALAHSNLQHARIVGALASGDGAAARAAMLEHISGTKRFLGGLLPLERTVGE